MQVLLNSGKVFKYKLLTGVYNFNNITGVLKAKPTRTGFLFSYLRHLYYKNLSTSITLTNPSYSNGVLSCSDNLIDAGFVVGNRIYIGNDPTPYFISEISENSITIKTSNNVFPNNLNLTNPVIYSNDFEDGINEVDVVVNSISYNDDIFKVEVLFENITLTNIGSDPISINGIVIYNSSSEDKEILFSVQGYYPFTISNSVEDNTLTIQSPILRI